jgi:putative DNA methylase
VTKMIERWFPGAEVSASSTSGWGSGNTERSLFTWFAARPTAQAKAALITSLLPWPDDVSEQERLQKLVIEAMTGRYAAAKQLRKAIAAAHPGGVKMLDPFAGRGIIPLEAARLGIPSIASDYSPVAVLASELLTDFPFRDWSDEVPVGFRKKTKGVLFEDRPRLLQDVEVVLDEIGRKFEESVRDLYPRVEDKQPWGYLWAVTLPCLDCGHRFPLVGAYELRKAGLRGDRSNGSRVADSGQSYYVEGDLDTGAITVFVHDGPPRRNPILSNSLDSQGKKIRGKSAICPHCGHVHSVKTHQRMASEGLGRDRLLIVADLDPVFGKVYRLPVEAEIQAVERAENEIGMEPGFSPVLPAVPDERIPPEIGALVRPQLYGAEVYGDLMCTRQTLATVRLARTIEQVGQELRASGVSFDYVRALTGYAAAALVRKLRRSTRGCSLQPLRDGITDLYANQGTLSFSYDFFEAGSGTGPGTWSSLSSSTLGTLRNLMDELHGVPTSAFRSSAVGLPLADKSVTVVVTDPPYDALIYYSDSSDFFYTWLKRALVGAYPEIAVTNDAHGLQNKSEEIIVWDHRAGPDEHRDRHHYDTLIAKAFGEMRRVVEDDGLVTIVFGHGDPEVWQRLLSAIKAAGLVMTASWPANTEAGGSNGGMASIETTLTMACRPAPRTRAVGRKAAVEAEVKREVSSRVLMWEKAGLAPTDMLMAAAGPAMEAVGKYSEVLDSRGEVVDISTFLPLARAAVQEAMAVEIDHQPLETFDARTRFALWWVRLYGRQVAAKSELRWQVLAAQIDMQDVRDLVPDSDKGCRFVMSRAHSEELSPESSVIDVVLAMASAYEDGLSAVADLLAQSGRTAEDAYLWAAIGFLTRRLPDSDLDVIAWTGILRNKASVGSLALSSSTKTAKTSKESRDESQPRLF